MTDRDPYESYKLGSEEESETESAKDWSEVMEDLESWEGQAQAKIDQVLPAGTDPEQPASEEEKRPLTRYEQLCRTPSIKMEAGDLDVMTEFSEIIARVNEATRMVERLQNDHPDYMSERMYSLWISNLRDAAHVMMREFHNLRNGRQQKKYDKRYICKKCHSVFLAPLPGGICDECRADDAPRVGNQ